MYRRIFTCMSSLNLAALVIGFALAGTTFAAQITFTFIGTGTGTVNGVPFTNAAYTITLVGDTTAITSSSNVYHLVGTTATMAIASSGTATITQPVEVFNNQNVTTLGFAREGGYTQFCFNNIAFNAYALATSLGPISDLGPQSINQFTNLASNLGPITLLSSSPVTFFAINTYTITVTAGSGGAVTPGSTTVNYGANQTFSITPNTGYHAVDVLVDGVSVGAVASYPFNNVTANHTISATFAINTYTVTAQVGGDPAGGSVTPASQTVNHGGTATFTVTTNTGYTASVSEGTLSGTTWTIPNVTSTHTATVTFTINTYTVTAQVGGDPAGGSVTPASQTVNHGGTATFTVTTNTGYTASVSEGTLSGTTWTIPNVTSTHTATVTAAVQIQSFPFFDDFSTDKGWLGYEPSGWERLPAFAGVGENGNPDPEMDYSPSDDNYILGFTIGADYPNDLTEEKSIISPPIDCTGQDQVFLKFRRWLNVESSQPEPNVEGDHAKIHVSNDGIDWTEVWENPPIDLMDNEWVPAVLDISSIAANQATVYIKFTMGPTNSSRPFSGWNIDDFEVTSEAIYPSEGTMGTELEITGSNFGAKKGKVLIGTTALTIIDWGSDLIHSRLTKALTPGVYDITIQPVEPKGVSPIVEKDGFVVKAPEIYSIEQGEGTANDQVTIKGKYFGTKKGKVYLEYGEGENLIRKSCKVSSWTMDPTTGDSEIVFVVPVILPEVCDVVVDPYGAIPETDEEDGFTVKAPEIVSVNPNSGSVSNPITISGNFFGSKKGKVYLGYVNVKNGKYTKKSCSVSSWPTDPTKEEGEIVFTVPNLPVGAYDIIVTNVVGSAQYGQKFNIE